MLKTAHTRFEDIPN